MVKLSIKEYIQRDKKKKGQSRRGTSNSSHQTKDADGISKTEKEKVIQKSKLENLDITSEKVRRKKKGGRKKREEELVVTGDQRHVPAISHLKYWEISQWRQNRLKCGEQGKRETEIIQLLLKNGIYST